MPRNKKARPSRRRRGNNKRPSYATKDAMSRYSTTVSQGLGPIAPRTLCIFRYTDAITAAGTSTVAQDYQFRLNSLFDFDFTGTGHQPMGFDQMMLFYNHFCVVKAKMTVVFRNTLTTSMQVGLRQDASSTPITVIDRIIELGGCVLEHLEPSGVYGSEKRLELWLDVRRLQGVSNLAITADPTLRGDAATSPTEVSYFHLQAWDALANTGAIWGDIVLEQYVTFLEPRDAVES